MIHTMQNPWQRRALAVLLAASLWLMLDIVWGSGCDKATPVNSISVVHAP